METTSPLTCNSTAGHTLQLNLKHSDSHGQEHHCERVANIAVQTGHQLGLDDASLYQLETAAIFHDIGKIGLPDEILLNADHLTEAQHEQMKTHALIGANVAEKLDIPDAAIVAKIIRHHHEHFDGSGYPLGLKGEEIPLSSRIIGIIDAFDSLNTDHSCYDPIHIEKILTTMSEEMLDKFDPYVFKVVADLIKNIGPQLITPQEV